MTRISVIIPVRNEENLILHAIARLRDSDSFLPTEIIVVDGGSTDHTVDVAEKSAERVILSPKASRSYQMHLGAQHAKGDILVFLHVDSRLPAHWQNLVVNSFIRSAHSPVATAFRIAFDSQKSVYRVIAALANWRTKITGIPYGDQALIVTRAAYFAAGGFPDVPLMEEYLFLPRLVRLGRIEIYPEVTITSVRKYTARGPLRNALKNSLLVLLFYMGVSPTKLASWYWME